MELYVHIPFCVRKCRYCDFVSFPDRDDSMEPYVDLLLQEAQQRAAILPASLRSVETMYIGGGTPSLLPPRLLLRLMQGLRNIFNFNEMNEFTAEANPGTITRAWAETARQVGITRVSMGMQAAQPHILRTLGRIHTAQDVSDSLNILRQAGICHFSLDLMFGIPGQSRADWRQTLDTAIALAPEHISAYGLIPEPGTPLACDLDSGICTLPDPEEERTMYEDAIDLLSCRGFRQYEISNFALEGCACRHNIGYWLQIPYLGLGLAAASMFPLHELNLPELHGTESPGYPCLRQTNPYSFEAYRSLLDQNPPPERDALRTAEIVSSTDAQFETMMLGLRMNEGVNAARFRRLHGVSLEEVYGPRLRALAAVGLVHYDNTGCRLTRRGMDLQNSVLVELMDD